METKNIMVLVVATFMSILKHTNKDGECFLLYVIPWAYTIIQVVHSNIDIPSWGTLAFYTYMLRRHANNLTADNGRITDYRVAVMKEHYGDTAAGLSHIWQMDTPVLVQLLFKCAYYNRIFIALGWAWASLLFLEGRSSSQIVRGAPQVSDEQQGTGNRSNRMPMTANRSNQMMLFQQPQEHDVSDDVITTAMFTEDPHPPVTCSPDNIKSAKCAQKVRTALTAPSPSPGQIAWDATHAKLPATCSPDIIEAAKCELKVRTVPSPSPGQTWNDAHWIDMQLKYGEDAEMLRMIKRAARLPEINSWGQAESQVAKEQAKSRWVNKGMSILFGGSTRESNVNSAVVELARNELDEKQYGNSMALVPFHQPQPHDVEDDTFPVTLTEDLTRKELDKKQRGNSIYSLDSSLINSSFFGAPWNQQRGGSRVSFLLDDKHQVEPTRKELDKKQYGSSVALVPLAESSLVKSSPFGDKQDSETKKQHTEQLEQNVKMLIAVFFVVCGIIYVHRVVRGMLPVIGIDTAAISQHNSITSETLPSIRRAHRLIRRAHHKSQPLDELLLKALQNEEYKKARALLFI